MAKRRRRTRNHGWINYFTDAQFDTVMWIYEMVSVSEKQINATTLRFLLKEKFVEVNNGFVRVTPLFQRMVNTSSRIEERNEPEPMSAREILDERSKNDT